MDIVLNTVLKRDGKVKKNALNVFHFEQCCITKSLGADLATERQYIQRCVLHFQLMEYCLWRKYGGENSN
jgi:hypothetical protein